MKLGIIYFLGINTKLLIDHSFNLGPRSENIEF